MFAFRHSRTRNDLMQQGLFPDAQLHVAVTGASGLVGSSLCAFLSTAGHRVSRIGRDPETSDITWDPSTNTIDWSALEGLDAVIHLAGESILGLRWTRAKKRRILESRVSGTRMIAEGLSRLERPPRVLISASAVGFYGDRGEEIVEEESGPGTGFLADVCQNWERASDAASNAGIRVVNLRIGMVLSATGGALAAQRPVFTLGLGGRFGSGNQAISWITLDDLVYAIHFLMHREDLSGPVNATAPRSVTNAGFARALGRVLSRPAFLPVPGFALKAALGEMAQEMMLGGAHARPGVLTRAGFEFSQPDLMSALRMELGRLG
jgi:uncharacterized protein (TIGR01777 family)